VVSLNFKKQFAEKVASGEKRQTIRAIRKRPFQKGDRLQLYTGMRTRNCRKLVDLDPVCREVWEIELRSKGRIIALCKSLPDDPRRLQQDSVLIKVLAGKSADAFAEEDGFTNAEKMFEFFEKTHGLPFKGQLIVWEF
jgi:hypothetical protein